MAKMGAARTSLVTGVCASACALAVVAGSAARGRIDSGAPLLPVAELQSKDRTLLASKGKDIPEGDFFKEMVRLLKREFVEPIRDERELALGAVKGMVLSLGDWESQFYEPREFAALLSSFQGRSEGIGIELAFEVKRDSKIEGLVPDDSETSVTGDIPFPELRVVSVVPGGPADKAGVITGDVVDSVDGRWVPDPRLILKLRQWSEKVAPKALAALPGAEAERLKKEYRQFAQDFRDKWQHRITPHKAKSKLMVGTEGTVSVTWRRGAAARTTALKRAATAMKDFQVVGNSIYLPFHNGVAKRLKAALAGKKQVTIDLRGGGTGSYAAMTEALAVLAPAGSYGVIDSQRPDKDQALQLKVGNAAPPKVTLLVDKSTRGPAEIFALALSAKGVAKLQGGPMSGERSVVDIVPLPDGSGYTLVVGEYSVDSQLAKTPARAAAGSRRAAPVAAVARRSPYVLAVNEISGVKA